MPKARHRLLRTIAKIAIAIALIGECGLSPSTSAARGATRTPIHRLIVIVGENRSFDHLFATYRPIRSQSVANLLSAGIVNLRGAPGPGAASAQQWQASAPHQYSIAPRRTNPFEVLPQPNTTFAFGRKPNQPDSRFPPDLPNAPFQISRFTAYQNSFTGDPAHRFFQMWQQFDEGRRDLFPWVAITAGTGSEGKPPPAPFTNQSTNQGGLSMGFYNMNEGDVPVFKFIADHYAISDNFHQGIMGGTGASFIYLGTGDVAFYSDGSGTAKTPPAELIEDPNPWPETNNWYTKDGYTSGTYVNCSDPAQPGVAPILTFLHSQRLRSRCDPGHYYLVNNYGPAYNPDGTRVDVKQHPYTLPPQMLPTIFEALSAAGVSWKYYIGGLKRPAANDAWCSICNPLQFSKRVMTSPLRANITDVSDFYHDIDKGTLPEVSFVRPYEAYSGHPANSSVSAYEYFVLGIANYVIARPELFADAAILITFDEGGGYYDSGYIQTLDFFGDGTRIPLLVISPWVVPGTVNHVYSDHASILKFIEANWGLQPLSRRSRDNLPNPIPSAGDPYIPRNTPALGDLMSIFDFKHKQSAPPLIIPGAI